MAEERLDLAPGRAAIATGGVLEAAVEAAEAASLRGIDGRKAAMAGIKMSKGIDAEGRRAQFEAFQGEWWDLKHLNQLLVVALAFLSVVEDLRAAEVGLEGVQVPDLVLNPAVKLRKHMIEVLEYVCWDKPKILEQVADIRKGHGYLDLISDLGRLAKLYRDNHITLSRDQIRYQAGDAQAADDAAGDIRAELTKAGIPDYTRLRELLGKLFGLLRFSYEEVAAAGRFLWRHSDGESRFPALRTLALG